MDAQVQAALITGICTALIAPVITLVAKSRLEGIRWKSRELTALGQAISGAWELEITRDIGPDGKPYKKKMNIEFGLSKGRIKGTFIDSWKSGYREPYTADGELREGRFLVLDCRPKRREMLQFSVMVVKIDDDPKLMKGKLIGYGALTRALIIEDVTFTRTA